MSPIQNVKRLRRYKQKVSKPPKISTTVKIDLKALVSEIYIMN